MKNADFSFDKCCFVVSPICKEGTEDYQMSAILIMSQSADRQLVIPAWMPESSHKDVNLGVVIKPFSNTYATDKLPSVALDSGIHAGMTALEP